MNPLEGKTRTIRIRKPAKGTDHFAVSTSEDWFEWNHPAILGLVEIILMCKERNEIFRRAIKSLRQSGITVDVR